MTAIRISCRMKPDMPGGWRGMEMLKKRSYDITPIVRRNTELKKAFGEACVKRIKDLAPYSGIGLGGRLRVNRQHLRALIYYSLDSEGIVIHSPAYRKTKRGGKAPYGLYQEVGWFIHIPDKWQRGGSRKKSESYPDWVKENIRFGKLSDKDKRGKWGKPLLKTGAYYGKSRVYGYTVGKRKKVSMRWVKVGKAMKRKKAGHWFEYAKKFKKPIQEKIFKGKMHELYWHPGRHYMRNGMKDTMKRAKEIAKKPTAKMIREMFAGIYGKSW